MHVNRYTSMIEGYCEMWGNSRMLNRHGGYFDFDTKFSVDEPMCVMMRIVDPHDSSSAKENSPLIQVGVVRLTAGAYGLSFIGKLTPTYDSSVQYLDVIAAMIENDQLEAVSIPVDEQIQYGHENFIKQWRVQYMQLIPKQ